MSNRSRSFISAVLFTIAFGLAGVGIGAHAAPGFNVTPEQQAQVKPGMSRSEVLQLIGQPAIDRQYRNQPGPTWIYRLLSFGRSTVHVDFGADGRVTSVSEQMDYECER